MSILKRIRTILASNIHDKINHTKNSEKEINQFIRDMERDVRETKAESEATNTALTRARRELNECLAEMSKMERYAKKALEANDEDKARRFLEEKVKLRAKKEKLEKDNEILAIRAEQMRLVQDKLAEDLNVLINRRNSLVGKLRMAESKERAMDIGPSQSNVRLTAFDQLEEKANLALAEAEAKEELRKGLDFDIDSLT